MPKLSTICYSTKQGFKNIRRNRMFSLASIGTMTACLFLFGIFYFVLSNLQFMIRSAETSVGITVFFEEGITEEEIAQLGATIRTRTEVESCRYVSPEEAWEKCKEKFLSEELAATFKNDNPLENSASFEIYLDDISKQETMVKYLKSLPKIRSVNNSEELAKSLNGFNRAVTYISGAIIVILLCVAAFLISTTVTTGISVRKEEISIMKLIGASDFFIRAPFVVEGLFIGAIGAAIPLSFLYLLYYKIIEMITEKFNSTFQSFSFLSAGEIFHLLIPISFGIGMGIGFLGSYFTVRRQLKKMNS